MSVHETAGAGFERGADEYERGRPSYPQTAVEDIASALRLGPDLVVTDIAAGTGKLTRLLLPTGATVVAVEPVAAMRAMLSKTAPSAIPVAAVAEAMPFDDESLDAATVAQAFHWFEAEVALAEIARVLRPGGGMALIWNERDMAVPWQVELKQLMTRIAGTEMARYRSGEGVWERALAADARFTPVDHRRYANDVEMDRSTFAARISSTSYVSALDNAARIAVVDEALRLAPLGERIVEKYVTEVYLCSRTS